MKRNRERLVTVAGLPQMPVWLEQVHGTRVVTLTGHPPADLRADAVYNVHRQVCAVMTADCLPVLFCSQHGDEVAAAHAGWRGYATACWSKPWRRSARRARSARLGPAIGPQQFEVGPEVRAAFIAEDAKPRRRLRRTAISFWLIFTYWRANVCCGQACRPSMAATAARLTKRVIFSYRRDGITGRLASLIWLI